VLGEDSRSTVAGCGAADAVRSETARNAGAEVFRIKCSINFEQVEIITCHFR